MGNTQHTTGVLNVLTLANLQMLLGNMGVPGGGVNPLRRAEQRTGCVRYGGLPNVFPGYQSVTNEAMLERFNLAWQPPTPMGARRPCSTTSWADLNRDDPDGWRRKGAGAGHPGENPVMTEPDVNHTRECLKACEFIVLQEIFPSETSHYADVLLPGVTFAEKEGTFTNTERRVQMVRQAIQPEGEARPDWEILANLAKRILAVEERSRPAAMRAGIMPARQR